MADKAPTTQELLAKLGLEVVEAVPQNERKPRENPFWTGVSDVLKTMPNKWCKVKTYGSDMSANMAASKIRKGDNTAFAGPAGTWEAKVHKQPVLDDEGNPTDKNTGDLYLRYVSTE